MDHPFLSKAFLDNASALFDRAEELAEDDTILRRVEEALLPILYVIIMQGPERAGKNYLDMIDRFELIARRVGLTTIKEGSPDLDSNLSRWRKAAAE